MRLHDESFILISISNKNEQNNLEPRRRKNEGIETKRLTDYNYLFVIIILYYLWNVFSVRFHIQIVARPNAHQLTNSPPYTGTGQDDNLFLMCFEL